MFGKKKPGKKYRKMVDSRKERDERFEEDFDFFEDDEELYEEDDEFYEDEDEFVDEDGEFEEDDESFDEDESYEDSDSYEADDEEDEWENDEDFYEDDDSEQDSEEFEEDDEDLDGEIDPDGEDDFDYEGDEDDDYDFDDEDALYAEYVSERYSRSDRSKKKSKSRKAAGRTRGKHERGGIGAIAAFFMNMKGVDWVVAFAGILVLILALVTGTLYYDYHSRAKQVASFEGIGSELEDINIVGESGLLAIGNAQQEKLASMLEEEELIEEEVEEEEVIEEEEEDDLVQVVLKVTSIQSDIKIKFVNESTGKLIGGAPFIAKVVGDNGKEFEWDDKDQDGIIYHTEVPNGTYKITVNELSGAWAERYAIPKTAESIKVTDQIAYKKVDVKEEIKTEAQVNAAVEDTAVQNTEVESTLKDTVEWVESTKKSTGTEDAYEEVKDGDISLPKEARNVTGGNKMLVMAPRSKHFFSLLLREPDGTDGTGNEEGATGGDGGSDSGTGSGSEEGNTGGGDGGDSGAGSGDGGTGSGDGGSGQGGSETTQTPNLKFDKESGSVSVEVGKETTISLTCKDETSGETVSVSWSGGGDVASISASGTVKGLKAGTTKVTATAKKGDKTATQEWTVTVSDVAADMKVSLDKTSATIKVGESVTLTPSVSGTDKSKVEWKSSDTSIATVSAGTVKGVKEGKATITISLTADSSKTATCEVTVTSDKKDYSKDTTALKDKSGNQLYKKVGDKYEAATYADYYGDYKKNGGKFYRKSSKDTGYTYTGWQTIDGSTYFFDKDGNKVTGDQVIQGAKYSFGSDGRLSAGSGTMGIDVSKWNGNIDWTAVRNSGVSYVIIRCGYRGSSTGAMIEDPKFRANIQGAKAAGLSVGVYFFTQAVNEVEAVEEASMVLSLINGKGVNLPVYLDVEASGGRGDKISKETRTAVCKAFCATIQNSGYKAGIYANKTWFTSYINTGSLTSYKIWLAQYAASPTYTATRYDMWQYSSKGSVAGISGNVDMNIRYN